MPRRKKAKTRTSHDETLGHRVARLRRERGMTQTELAKRLRIGQSVISHYERSRRGLDSDIVVELTRVFGVTADELLGLSEPATDGLKVARPFLRRLRDVDRLSRIDQKALLRTIDAFLKGALAAGRND
jgi:transcriptional regulator with XRE-family HTH domain